MLQVGVVLHRAKSGRLIVRLSREVRPGVPILDGEGWRLGNVVELIGPVRAPYASVVVTSSRISKTGDAAYVEG
ncbi:MAG: Gar1/Naf1 family protein [Nitrososphaerales archaeon]